MMQTGKALNLRVMVKWVSAFGLTNNKRSLIVLWLDSLQPSPAVRWYRQMVASYYTLHVIKCDSRLPGHGWV